MRPPASVGRVEARTTRYDMRQVEPVPVPVTDWGPGDAWSPPTRRRSWTVSRAIASATATWVALGAILLAGAAIRVVNLNDVGYNTDEAVYSGQAAAIAQDPVLTQLFPVFRAHPLLIQFLLALAYASGTSDLTGRLMAVGIGLGTVGLTFLLGRLLYGRSVGLLAAAFMALMPYHVVVSRQMLLDGPMVFLATLTLLLVAKFAASGRPRWLYAAGATMGLTFLAKETGIVLLGAIYTFLALRADVRVRIRDLFIATGLMALVIAPFPLSLMLAGGGGTERTRQYLVWQLFRQPNHEFEFYATAVIPALGILVVAAALIGLVALRRRTAWPEVLLVAWIIVPIAFFQLWPVKGFQYLLPIAPPVAILAARAVTSIRPGWLDLRNGWVVNRTWLRPILAVVLLLSLALPSALAIAGQPGTSTFLAGSGGVPGGREAGTWIRDHTPAGAKLMTVGPSMANVLQFYGHRPAYGLSVSPNPLKRNPSYEPLVNPDLLIRANEIQYVVWDSYSAARSPFFADKLMSYVRRYNGRAVHTETVPTRSADGDLVEAPVIVIYEVRP